MIANREWPVSKSAWAPKDVISCLKKLRPLQINSLFLIPPEPKNWCERAAGNGRLITSLMGNGRLNHKFGNWSGILLYCAGADGNTCGRKSRGDEKQPIDLEWPNVYVYTVTVYSNWQICMGLLAATTIDFWLKHIVHRWVYPPSAPPSMQNF